MAFLYLPYVLIMLLAAAVARGWNAYSGGGALSQGEPISPG
jgi:hypothetical protein